MAFSFDLWDAYLSNRHPTTGRTLREEIDARLDSFTYPPQDMALARAKLAEVNTLIRKTFQWTEEQKTRIVNELIAAFPDVPHDEFLRFRSSSNAEDSQELTGAGLYDSFSGCIADDTDGDTKGPSRADPNEPDEKGVLRAIEKVFASFYNENAWLERLRHGVREQDTGMAILVHHNFPDELEMANGVVTFKYVRSQWGDYQEVSYSASIVTQLGALSVTNPEGGAVAEEVNAFFGPGQTPYLYLQTPSTLVPIGGTVMTWESDYAELMQLIARVAEGYAELYPNKTEFTLDLEFKRMDPGELIVKQVREIPTVQSEMTKPKVLNEATDWRVLAERVHGCLGQPPPQERAFAQHDQRQPGHGGQPADPLEPQSPQRHGAGCGAHRPWRQPLVLAGIPIRVGHGRVHQRLHPRQRRLRAILPAEDDVSERSGSQRVPGHHAVGLHAGTASHLFQPGAVAGWQRPGHAA